MTVMRFEADGRPFLVDFGKPACIAIPLDFTGAQPAAFGAPRAEAHPLQQGGFVGDTRAGGSCNCEVLTVAPHCNGTHTECVGHVTDARVAVHDRLPGGVQLALVVTIEPVAAEHSSEDSDPRPAAGDRLVTAASLEHAAARHAGPSHTALVARTATDGPYREYAGPSPAPYLTRQAAAWLVARGIESLVLDLPSADRADDGGRLTAHRVFFGLPPGSRDASAARRPRASITELAWIGPEVADGWYLLDLQIPPFIADAAPSRPLLYPVAPA
jgi:arylformamidase